VVVIVMGVSGAGKTTVGTALASALDWRFVEGDQLHPAANKAKMHAGVPLTEADRAPWLAALHAMIVHAVDRRENLVMACSALTDRYRGVLRGDCRGIRFVYLKVGQGVAAARSAARAGHFAGPALVPSQFATLEEPDDALTIDATLAPDRIVAAVRRDLGL
jgi:gluconokinase